MRYKTKLRILVLDDDSLMAKLHTRILSNLGYTSITTCENGQQALDAIDAAAEPYDLILLDLNMPGMDGIEFVRHLVERNYPGSIILVSGEDDLMLRAADNLVKAHKISNLGYLKKPVAPNKLAALVEQCGAVSRRTPLTSLTAYSAEAIKKAINHNELVNYYQPKISIQTGRTAGVEALVRWKHPTDGLLFPDEFISTAEENGLIGELTRKVVVAALADVRSWHLISHLGLEVAINVSMDDLRSHEFVEFLVDATKAAGVPFEHVTLEVTESRLMQDIRGPLEVLTRLRLKRFRISIDDFGTGHSSLAQLRDLPFDELKVDRSFVHSAWRDKKVAAIFQASVSLAKQLDMQISAEGIENRADWNFVRQSGCHFAQGYFIAKPMPANMIRQWVDDWDERVLQLTRTAIDLRRT